MKHTQGRSRRRVAVAAAISLVALGVAVPASAADFGVVAVTGGSQSTIELTLSDSSAQFGAGMTPLGDASGEAGVGTVDPGSPSVGACYEWAGSVTVRSNDPYGLTVDSNVDNNRLDFHTTDPGSYAACTSGEPVVDSSMYPSANPVGAWLNGQSRTASQTHDYWLGVDVRWTDPTNANLADATLTLTAGAGW